MDISRQQFENWFNENVFSIRLADKKLVRCYWDAWEASRQELKPAGYLSPSASVCLGRGKKTIISPESQNNYIPLYRLDK